MISTILAMAAVQGAVQERELTFEFVELLKFRANKRIESGRFAFSGVLDIEGEDPVRISSKGVVRGDKTKSVLRLEGLINMELVTTPEKLVGTMPEYGAFFEHDYDPPIVRPEKYEPSKLDPDEMFFALTGAGFAMQFGEEIMPQFLAQGDETRGDLKLHWVLHEHRKGEHYITVRQWFYADTWYLYEVMLDSDSKKSGRLSAHVKTDKWELNVEISDEELELKTEGLIKIPTPPEFISDGE